MWQAVGNTRMNQWASGALLTEGDLGDSAHGQPLLAIAGNCLEQRPLHTSTTGHRPQQHTSAAATTSSSTRASRAWASTTDRKSTARRRAPKFKDKGFLVQASYAWKAPGVVPGAGFWELAFRYAQIDPTDLVANNDRTEIGGALNYYSNKHNLKVQADFRQVKDDAANSGRGTKTKEFRLQTQFIF